MSVEAMLLNALDALKSGNVEPWVGMFADDGVMEFPYAPPGYTPRLEGKAAIADYMKSYPDHVAVREVIPGRMLWCGSVMVVEFTLEARAVPTGRDFRMQYVGVIDVEAGRIKRYRDYWNPLVAIEAMGGSEAVLSLGTKEQAA